VFFEKILKKGFKKVIAIFQNYGHWHIVRAVFTNLDVQISPYETPPHPFHFKFNFLFSFFGGTLESTPHYNGATTCWGVSLR
jgi:hypothetical protein